MFPMDNTSILERYVDPDPSSALYLGIWFAVVSIIGIPLNIFILTATVRVREIRGVPSNLFIGSLALSDTLLLLCFGLHLPYALSSNEILCKAIGFGVDTFVMVGTCIPQFLAANRYAVVCRQQEKLARYMLASFSKRGVYIMILVLWLLGIAYQLPFTVLNTLGLHGLGVCSVINISPHGPLIRIYYYCGNLATLSFCYFPLLIFYSKVSSWLKKITVQLSLSFEARQTIRETKSVLHLTKWVTLVPLLFSSPAVLTAVLLEFDSNILPMGVCRLISSLYPLIPLFNAILTLKYARPYRLALRKNCERMGFTSTLFSWIIEGRWLNKVDAISDYNTIVVAART